LCCLLIFTSTSALLIGLFPASRRVPLARIPSCHQTFEELRDIVSEFALKLNLESSRKVKTKNERKISDACFIYIIKSSQNKLWLNG